jgi:hypothetical protein
MGQATIVGSTGTQYVVRYDPRGPTLVDRQAQLAAELVSIDLETKDISERVEVKRLEIDAQVMALNAMIDDYIYRLNNGLDTDPPIDPKPPEDDKPEDPPQPDEVEPPNDGPGAMEGVPGALLSRHNTIRSAAGLSPSLTLDSRLTQAAQVQADYMARVQQCTHDGAGGTSPSQRIYAAGYPSGGMVGENVATGQSDFDRLMSDWMNSPGHKANIIRNGWTHIGVGYAHRPNGTYRHYYCVTFGKP